MVTRLEKKKLFGVLTPVVARQLLALKNHTYTFKEMAQISGLTQNRLSEIVNQAKEVNQKALVLLIGGGLVKLESLLKATNLTPAQKNYLETFSIYEDKGLKEEILMCKREGINPLEVLRSARMKKK